MRRRAAPQALALTLFADLARQGCAVIVAASTVAVGTMTGLSRVSGAGLVGRALQKLKRVVPSASRTGILWNAASDVAIPFDEAEGGYA